jgi:hypothetical protein
VIIVSKVGFRTLLVANWLLALAAYSVRGVDFTRLPPGLRDAYAAAYNTSAMPFGMGLYYALSYAYFLLFLISTAGLFAFRDFARGVYLAFLVLGFTLGLSQPSTVHGRLYYLAGSLFSLSSVLIFALIFLSPAKEFFRAGRDVELP